MGATYYLVHYACLPQIQYEIAPQYPQYPILIIILFAITLCVGLLCNITFSLLYQV
jgi:hypothetical protein